MNKFFSDIFSNIFTGNLFDITINIITFLFGSIIGLWIFAGMIVTPCLIIYLLYKHRKNKDEIVKILKPVILFVSFLLFYFLLTKCIATLNPPF